MTYFCIVCPARSGSNFLSTLLSSHPNIFMFNEIVNFNLLSEADMISLIEDPEGYIRSKLSGAERTDIHAVGFKIMYNQMSSEFFEPEIRPADVSEKFLERRSKTKKIISAHFSDEEIAASFKRFWRFIDQWKNLNVIHLSRRNMLRAYLSLCRAYAKDEWMILRDPDKSETASQKFRIDIADFQLYCEQTIAYAALHAARFSDHPSYVLDYERLTSDEVARVEIQNFLGVSNQPLTSVLKKQTKGDLTELIANMEEVGKYCQEHEMQDFLG